MKNYLLLVLLCSTALFSCKSDDDTIIIEEPVGASIYVVNNQSTIDLEISFITSSQLGSEVVSFGSINNGSSEQIFQDAVIGVNPTPQTSFSEITFLDANSESELLVITDIASANWQITELDFEEGETYGVTTYELAITDDDVN